MRDTRGCRGQLVRGGSRIVCWKMSGSKCVARNAEIDASTQQDEVASEAPVKAATEDPSSARNSAKRS